MADHGDWFRADREIILSLDQDRLHKDALLYIRNKLRRAFYR